MNFPLPRELRNKIYGYLLAAEHVRKEPDGTRKIVVEQRHDGSCPICPRGVERNVMPDPRPQYEFHTALLSVNHGIGGEAREMLYGNNDFIVVSYKWAGFLQNLERMGVPVVNKTHKLVAR
ncbi:hypothetical protein LTS18_007148, partial [Coniosporium uncinatum]